MFSIPIVMIDEFVEAILREKASFISDRDKDKENT